MPCKDDIGNFNDVRSVKDHLLTKIYISFSTKTNYQEYLWRGKFYKVSVALLP